MGEVSRQCAASALVVGETDAMERPTFRSTGEAVLGVLERRCLGVLVMHEFVEYVVLNSLIPYKRDLTMFWFELPAVLVWSLAIASVFVWIENPIRVVLDHAVSTLRKQASHSSLAFVFLACSLAGLLTLLAIQRVCGEELLNPCIL